MKKNYVNFAIGIERIHRLFLEVIKGDLHRIGIKDINNVQGLILYNIGSDQVSIGDLTNRGYYLGSNVSYNLRKMIENGYIIQENSLHDARSSYVKLSLKGLDLYQKLDILFSRHREAFSNSGGSDQAMIEANSTLARIEEFWASLLD